MEKMTNTEYELMIKLGSNKSTHEILTNSNGPKTTQQLSCVLDFHCVVLVKLFRPKML